MLTISFRAMDTEIEASVAEPCDQDAVRLALDAVALQFQEYEQTLSRFLPDSELSALNRAAGTPFIASPLLFRAVRTAVEAAERFDGIFDPTVLNALLASGYDKTFADLAGREHLPAASQFVSTSGSYRAIGLHSESRSITLPAGVHLDLGGIGKGLAVDAATDLIRPYENFFMNAGGDIAVAGQAEDGPWLVGVQDPFNLATDLAVVAPLPSPRPPALTLTLLGVRKDSQRSCWGFPRESRKEDVGRRNSVGVATSSILGRRWRRGGVEHHHLIDPRTGTSAVSDLAAVTIVAPTATEAELIAKVALILGMKDGRALVAECGVQSLFVRLNGTLEVSERFPAVYLTRSTV